MLRSCEFKTNILIHELTHIATHHLNNNLHSITAPADNKIETLDNDDDEDALAFVTSSHTP